MDGILTVIISVRSNKKEIRVFNCVRRQVYLIWPVSHHWISHITHCLL